MTSMLYVIGWNHKVQGFEPYDIENVEYYKGYIAASKAECPKAIQKECKDAEDFDYMVGFWAGMNDETHATGNVPWKQGFDDAQTYKQMLARVTE